MTIATCLTILYVWRIITSTSLSSCAGINLVGIRGKLRSICRYVYDQEGGKCIPSDNFVETTTSKSKCVFVMVIIGTIYIDSIYN